MAGQSPLTISLPLLLLLHLLLFQFSEASSCGIAVYWGQHENEGTLSEACSATPLYKYISIAFLDTFGSGQTPTLNLTGHCSDPPAGKCKTLASEITSCQQKGIKVLLSLGGPTGSYSLDSQQEASRFANILYNTYLSVGGPLGNVVLDGVDFDIQEPGSAYHWDHLAKAISGYTKADGGKFYLSASPGCSYPDHNLGAAIRTGVFDSVWVKFYDNHKCDITSSGVGGVLAAWHRWSDNLPEGTQLLMGLPGFSNATTTGYVDPNKLVNEILPVIRYSPNYGGIMVWNRYYDVMGKYSETVYPEVCPRPRTFLSQVV